MGDIENFNEIIDDLKDEIHDLQHDLRASEKENGRLEAEIQDNIEEEELSEAAHSKEIAVMVGKLMALQETNKHLEGKISELVHAAEVAHEKYVKALSIAGTIADNRNTDYFYTKQGKELMDWAVKQLEYIAYNRDKGVKNG